MLRSRSGAAATVTRAERLGQESGPAQSCPKYGWRLAPRHAPTCGSWCGLRSVSGAGAWAGQGGAGQAPARCRRTGSRRRPPGRPQPAPLHPGCAAARTSNLVALVVQVQGQLAVCGRAAQQTAAASGARRRPAGRHGCWCGRMPAGPGRAPAACPGAGIERAEAHGAGRGAERRGRRRRPAGAPPGVDAYCGYRRAGCPPPASQPGVPNHACTARACRLRLRCTLAGRHARPGPAWQLPQRPTGALQVWARAR